MKPILLCILDGVGINNNIEGNALKAAKTPNFDYLMNTYPNSLLEASSTAVGLPEGQMGNSEVGHINIGTGRCIKNSLNAISESLNTGEFASNKEFLKLIKHVQTNNSNLHICGLLSNGGIHSHIDHLIKIIDILKDKNINIYYHLFTDGRDTKPNESLKFLKILEDKIKETNCGKIATISGRYYSMDRDNRWDRIEKAYKEMTEVTETHNYKEEIQNFYKNNITDEFIPPFTVENGIISKNDGILVFNFRPDRLRELFSALTNPNFQGFDRKYIPNLKLLTMMPVDKSVICENAFNHPKIENYLGEILEKNNLKQLRIAETEKYPHVTYFFNGENTRKLNNCDEILIPSPKVTTYDLKPEMSAYEITETLLKIIDKYDIIILNFANGDMVGHTGDFNATIKGLEAVDKCIGKIYDKIEKINGTMIITADHGNCDQMKDENGILTSHSLSKVPLIITNKNINLNDGKLSDVAPTILEMLNISKPNEMTGKSLIK